MNQSEKILMIGLRADCVNYEKWPELSFEKLEAAFAQVLSEFTAAGYDARWCLTDQGDTAEAQVEELLLSEQPDIVLIGAGIRTDPDMFLLFEKIINSVHKHAPNAKIAFNQLPYDSVEAVNRWSVKK